MRLTVELSDGERLRVQGPAEVRVEDGRVMVLGAEFLRGSSFEVHEARSYCLEALSPSRVEVRVASGGSVEVPREGEEVVASWVETIDRLLDEGARSFIVVGPTDAGKTSLAAVVLNRSLLRGEKPAVVDADVGQADVGPPGFISASRVRRFTLWLRELWAERMRFVGSITPQRNERRIVGAVVDLAWRMRSLGSTVIVVDTDGWVEGLNALEYKVEAARLAGVDAAICVGCDEALWGMVSRLFSVLPYGVRRVSTPAVRRERDRCDRRRLRSEGYRRYLHAAIERIVDLRSTPVLGACSLSAPPLPEELRSAAEELLGVKVVYASQAPDAIYVVVAGQPKQGAAEQLSEALGKPVYIYQLDHVRGAVCALVGEDGEEKAMGIVRSVDFSRMWMTILTPYRGPLRAVVLGNYRVDESTLEEVGKPQRCLI